MAGIKVGDLVKLKSGGPTMTVEGPDDDVLKTGQVRCQWFSGSRLSRAIFHQDALVPDVAAPGIGRTETNEDRIRRLRKKAEEFNRGK
jgi:uncharacterized protein YodC (DUF2158 family)